MGKNREVQIRRNVRGTVSERTVQVHRKEMQEQVERKKIECEAIKQHSNTMDDIADELEMSQR